MSAQVASTDIPATTAPGIPALDSIDKALEALEGFMKSHKAMVENGKQSLKELTAVKSSFTKARREVEKGLRKKSKVKSRISDPNKPTGFKKPIAISPELAKFLKVPQDELMSRTDVTKAINAYIKQHSLQNPQAKREFILNKSAEGKALNTLLSPSGDQPVSYFNLQRWLAPHFPKAEGAVATPATTPAAAPAPAAAAAAPPRRKPARK